MSGLAVERTLWRNQSAARACRGRAESARPRLTSRGSWRERLARRAVMVVRRALLESKSESRI
jgi:hypothetical protein